MERESKVFRLARPRRRGLLPLLFSRFLLIALLLLLQLLVLASFFVWLKDYVPYLSVLQGLFTFGMVVFLFNSGMDAAAKLTWMFLIAVFPLPGATLLCFTRADVGHRLIRERVQTVIDGTRDALAQPPGVLEALGRDGGGTDDLARYLGRSGCFPVYAGTAARYLASGEAYFAAVLEALDGAERYILLEYFIIEEGLMWGEILRRLVEKAAQGVEVRVLYDGMCEVSALPGSYARLLREKGIRAKAFSPIRPLVSSHYNYRDHRKLLVVDGRVAFTGGVNLADEYINLVERFGHWKDTGVRLEGAAARSFVLLFLQMWNLDEREPDFSLLQAPDAAPEHPDAGYVLPYGDSPLDDEKVGEMVYMDILNRANDYVHIMTPYLILDGELETALRFAAERGVEVSLILPGIPDKKLPYALARSHYAALEAAGVRIYEYTPGFVHAKVCVSDGCKAVVGSINLDYRSLYHHFECAAYLYRCPCIAEIERDFQATRALCRRVTAGSIRKEKLFYRLAGGLLKFIAPLL